MLPLRKAQGITATIFFGFFILDFTFQLLWGFQ
jgi:hypothetical protein